MQEALTLWWVWIALGISEGVMQEMANPKWPKTKEHKKAANFSDHLIKPLWFEVEMHSVMKHCWQLNAKHDSNF